MPLTSQPLWELTSPLDYPWFRLVRGQNGDISELGRREQHVPFEGWKREGDYPAVHVGGGVSTQQLSPCRDVHGILTLAGRQVSEGVPRSFRIVLP